jgi:thioredoxin-related protein
MAARPVVDRIAQSHPDDLLVVRLNIQDASTAPLARKYGFQHTPTFLLFDGQGTLLLRGVGAIDPQAVDQLLPQG